jgi:lysophospholipase L1-like esterase
MPETQLMSCSVAIALFIAAASNAEEATRWQFDFGPGGSPSGFTQVDADDKYTDEAGFGFVDPVGAKGGTITGVDRGGSEPICADFCTSSEPFAFAVKAPEGNYRITVTLGAAEADSTTTIHAEVRRLLADRLHLAKGETGRFSAIVNVRTPRIDGRREVALKPRERTDKWANWDDKLTLTFSGEHPAVAGLEIVRDDRCPTLYLVGDSTVCDQLAPPWNSWGQMIPRFFGPTIAVANHAESGESIRAALGERRIEKIYSLLKPGDWIALQFGHNDMKAKNDDAGDVYVKDLEAFVTKVRELGAMPIFVTSMERMDGIEKDTLNGYPEAMRGVAKWLDVALVDLNAMSRELYRGMGDDLKAAFQDKTHHQAYGSYHLARCVVEGIRQAVPELAKHLADDAGTFDPAKPEPAANWGMPSQLR